MKELPRDYSVWTQETDPTRYLPGTVPPDVRFTGPMTAPDAYRLRLGAAALFPDSVWSVRHGAYARMDVPLTDFHDCDRDHPSDPSFPPLLHCRFYGMPKASAESVTISFTVTDDTYAQHTANLLAAAPGVIAASISATDATGLAHPLRIS